MNQTVNPQAAQCYEEYPYPAHGIVSSVIPLMLKKTVDELLRRVGSKELDFLDAGCGTGEQALGMARAHPSFRVVGVDSNQASLRMAYRLAEKYRIAAKFLHRDLFEPLVDCAQFDLICCVGVLHYFPDPRPVLVNLRRHAREHTVLLGMVYGQYGKWEIFCVRDMLRLICGDDMPRGEVLEILKDNHLAVNTGLLNYARLLRKRWRFGPKVFPWEAVRRVVAGRSDAFQADTYTIAKEYAYTWEEMINVLDETGWQFLGWPTKSGMPDRPEQLFNGKALAAVKEKSLSERASIYERIVKPLTLYFLAKPKRT